MYLLKWPLFYESTTPDFALPIHYLSTEITIHFDFVFESDLPSGFFLFFVARNIFPGALDRYILYIIVCAYISTHKYILKLLSNVLKIMQYIVE